KVTTRAWTQSVPPRGSRRRQSKCEARVIRKVFRVRERCRIRLTRQPCAFRLRLHFRCDTSDRSYAHRPGSESLSLTVDNPERSRRGESVRSARSPEHRSHWAGTESGECFQVRIDQSPKRSICRDYEN